MAPDRRRRPERRRPLQLPEPAKPANYDNETPKFCLRYLARGYDVTSLSPGGQARFACALQKRATMTWQEIKLSPRHALGSELIPRSEIKRGVPARFEEQDKFTVLRYDDRLPMVGVRLNESYNRKLWIHDLAKGATYPPS